MSRAVAPLFVAAILILVVGAIVAGVRFGGDDGTVAVGPTATETTDATGTATETESPSPTPSPTDTEVASPSPTDGATGQQAQAGETESPGDEASPDDEASPSPTPTPTDDRTPLAIDDMPDTGGGAAALLAGFLVLTGAAGLVSRDR